MKKLQTLNSLAAVLLSFVLSTSAFAEVPEVPDFTLQTDSGDTWKLADHAGQPKLIMFWATWCPYCKLLFPTIQSLHEEHAADGLQVIAISVLDDGDQRQYREDNGLTMEILLNGEDLAEALRVPGTPTVILLNSDNEIVYGTMNSDPNNKELPMVVQALMEQSNR